MTAAASRVGMRRCSKCGLAKPRDAFDTKPNRMPYRRCRECGERFGLRSTIDPKAHLGRKRRNRTAAEADGEPMETSEIAAELGLTRQGVEHIVNRALRKLGPVARKMGLG